MSGPMEPFVRSGSLIRATSGRAARAFSTALSPELANREWASPPKQLGRNPLWHSGGHQEGAER